MKENNLLASVALFGELYNSDKYNSISDIIAEFIKGAVVYENKYSFNSTELYLLLKKVYEFDIPESVIRTTLNNKLKDAIERKDGYYHFNEKIKNEFKNIISDFDLINDVHKKINEDLIEFIEIKEKKILTEKDKKEVFENFNQFLLDNGISEKYSNHISGFIILNQDKPNFTTTLNAIKEGVILYQGIKYTADINELGKWNTDLTIYLSTEHLFSALGYNGLLFQEIFNDFLKLVNEINISNKNQINKNYNPKKRIELKYLEETKTEVDNYFLTAESINKGHKPLDPSKSAMKMILNKSQTSSDIKALRVKFDFDLKIKGITLQEFNHDISGIIKYNVEDNNILKELKKISDEKKKPFEEEKCRQHFRIFTKINYFRRGDSRKPFEKIGHIFITEKGFAKYLAHNNLVKFEEYDTPFAKDIDYIITRFWFKLKKGFSDKQSLPKSFDVVTKAKIILSSHINNTVSQGYHKLQEEIKNGNLSKEEAISRSYEFREKPNRPEEINFENVDISLDFLNNEAYYEDLYREKELKDSLFIETQAKNIELQNELNRRNLIEMEKENEIKLIEFNKRKVIYITDNWNRVKREKLKDSIFLCLIFIFNLFLIVSATILSINKELKEWISEFGFWQIVLLLIYAIIIVIEIFGRSYLFNKDKLKSGWNWLKTFMNDNSYKEFELKTKEHYDSEFIKLDKQKVNDLKKVEKVTQRIKIVQEVH